MGPVVEWIAEGMWNCRGPGLKFCEWIGITSAKLFGDAIGTHRAPFVMIAFEPNLGQVIELPILGNFAWRQMAMIIKNRLFLSEGVIKAFRSAILEREVF